MGKSMDYCRRGPLTNTKELEAKGKKVIVDTKVSGKDQVKNLEKHKPKNYETNKEYNKTLNLAKQRELSEREDSAKKPVATKKPGKMEKMPTLGPKKLSTGSYTREHDEYKNHTAKEKAVLPKKKVKKAKY